SSRRRHTRWPRDWSSDVCSSDLLSAALVLGLALSPAAAQPPRSVVVQTVTEPPGLDLTATPASATAAVVFYNIQEALVKVDRHRSEERRVGKEWKVGGWPDGLER